MSKKLKQSTKVRLGVACILVFAFLLMLVDVPQVYNKSIDFVNSKANTNFGEFKSLPFHLGLDLQGGTQLVYEADTSKIPSDEKSDSVEGVRDVIERRVNAFGVAEPVVQINKAKGSWRVLVELAGVKDVKEAIKMIGDTPILEFKEQNTDPARELTAEEKKQMNQSNKDSLDKANEALKEAKDGKDFTEVVKNYSENEIGQETGGSLGWISERSEYVLLAQKAMEINVGEVYPQVIDNNNGYYIMKLNDKRENGKQVSAKHVLICFEGAESCESGFTKEEAKEKIDAVKAEATVKNFEKLARDNSTGPSAPNGGDLGWFRQGEMVKAFDETVFGMENGTISDVVETEFGFHVIYKVDEKPFEEFQVAQAYFAKLNEADIVPPPTQWKNTDLTGKQLKNARVEFNQNTGIAEVALVFDSEGKDLFADITSRNVGQPVAIFLDNEPISVPRVNEAITGGEAVITGSFTLEEAKLLSQRLNAGALPVPIKLVSQQTVGASLGSESLQKSLFAGMIGLILVSIFMIAYYRLPGLLAVFALLIYGITVLFFFKLIPVTLTLAGIAGVILSIGMAVDANVLIFERLKEELKMGKPLGTAIEEGFKRAWTSIRDGNVSTLITCFILAWFGTSMIKGFAITLGIGVLISMFSAIVITKQFLNLFVNKDKALKRLWLFGVKKKQD